MDDLEDRVLTVRARSTPYGIEVTWDASYAPARHADACTAVRDFTDRSWFTPPPHPLLRDVSGADEIIAVDEFRIMRLHVRDAGRAGMVVDSFGYGVVDIDRDVVDDDAPTVALERLVAAVRDEAVRRRA